MPTLRRKLPRLTALGPRAAERQHAGREASSRASRRCLPSSQRAPAAIADAGTELKRRLDVRGGNPPSRVMSRDWFEGLDSINGGGDAPGARWQAGAVPQARRESFGLL
jgi:hypothetical protein